MYVCVCVFNKGNFLDFKTYNFQLKGTGNNHLGYNTSCSFLPQLCNSLGHAPFLGNSHRNKKDTDPLSIPLKLKRTGLVI